MQQHSSEPLFFPFERSNVKLGAGGNGEVWLGRHAHTHELVAMKKSFLRQQHRGSSSGASLAATVSCARRSEGELCPGEHFMLRRHPHLHIVPMLGACCPTPSAAYMALGLQDSDLSVEIAAGRTNLSEDVAKLVMYPVLAALAYLQSVNVVHRDVKPGNILLRRDPRRVLGAHVTLGDFGQAHYVATEADHGLDGGAEQEEEEQDYLSGGGTLYYQSPELLVGKVPPSGAHKCDMWAVGCTLYELLAGVAAFSGATQIQVIHQIHRRMGTDYQAFPDVVAPQSILDPLLHCSPPCQALLMGLLALDASKRLSVAEALAHPFFDGVAAVSDLVVAEEALAGRHLLTLKGFRAVDLAHCKFKPVLVEATPPFAAAAAAGGSGGDGGDDGGLLLPEDGGPPTVGVPHLVRNLNMSDESSIHVNSSGGSCSSSAKPHHTTTTARKGFLLVQPSGAACGGDAGGHPHMAYSNMRTTALFGDMSGQSTSSHHHHGGGVHSPSVGQHSGEHCSVSPRRAVKTLQFDQSPTPSPQRPAHATY